MMTPHTHTHTKIKTDSYNQLISQIKAYVADVENKWWLKEYYINNFVR